MPALAGDQSNLPLTPPVLAPGQLIAVKKVMILQMMSVKSRDKCLKEMKLLESMSHHNIIRYYDSFINDGDELVIVLEWAQGGDLKKLIKQVAKAHRVFSERQVWKYCMEISAGLKHMHDKRVMHRDLKPANIMLTSDNIVKLGDLGLSRYMNEATLEAFSKVGTPLYMSPEVLLGNGYGFSADIWSLGCVLYELCMLRSPFKPEKGVNLYELFRKIKSGQFDPIPSTLNYSSDLKNFIQSMLRLEPDKRPTILQVHQISTMAYQRLAAGGSAAAAAPPPPPQQQQQPPSSQPPTQPVPAPAPLSSQSQQPPNSNSAAAAAPSPSNAGGTTTNTNARPPSHHQPTAASQPRAVVYSRLFHRFRSRRSPGLNHHRHKFRSIRIRRCLISKRTLQRTAAAAVVVAVQYRLHLRTLRPHPLLQPLPLPRLRAVVHRARDRAPRLLWPLCVPPQVV